MTTAEAASDTSCQTYLRLWATFDVLYMWVLQSCDVTPFTLSVTLIHYTNDRYALVRLVTKSESQKRNPSAMPTSRHVSCIQRMNAVSYQKVYTNRQTYGVGNCVFHVMQMVCNANATINWLSELRPSSDEWKVTSCRVQFHANVGKRQLDWQDLLNQRMRTLPTCRTVAPHSVA
jgi:hypothetical protein